MIFPVISTDKVVQVNDKFAIDLRKTYSSKPTDPITSVAVDVGVEGVDPIELGVTKSNWMFAYQYAEEGIKTISVTITTSDGASEDPVITQYESEITIIVLSEEDDYLFSDDQDLKSIKTDILRWLGDDRTSFKYAHRQAQTQMIEWFKVNGYIKFNGEYFSKDDFDNIEEVRLWSTYLTLSMVMQDQSTTVGDVFSQWANKYLSEAEYYRDKVIVKLLGRTLDLRTKSLIRR